jgi:fumarate hydratase class I
MQGNAHGIGFRDLETEALVHKLCRDMGIGAQFGGKYFCHDVRVVRLPRHGASCPVGIGVSCSADRQCHAKINEKGASQHEPPPPSPAAAATTTTAAATVNN